ncbi:MULTISPECIES: helix-turn-helix transcriptional regulator [Dickeya]|uniref:Helix-turn-helix transcriptional regulator n=1 Tax=Dickeya oryzae TaxID=1240404 RepID=A0AB39IWQ6_9GAMM|nr:MULTISPECIES: AlpA family transcriptional regulator [Dickeya]MCA6990113.1 AlpA family transcriptional regulator [Dickeya oryzae]UAY95125.1 AlpA family transcriptional regulator [Dickeya dadantii]WES88947.1 AlpA family transcriptional regulator [Dickeya fangzhongdai]
MSLSINENNDVRLIRLKDVISKTGLPRSTLYRRMKEGLFPLNVSIGENSVAWVEHEVNDWINDSLKNRKSMK